MAGQYFEGVGRRKESIARVRVSTGSGVFVVNEKQIAAYFNRLGDVESILNMSPPSRWYSTSGSRCAIARSPMPSRR